MALLSNLALLFAVSHESGEAAGFGGFGAIVGMGQTIFLFWVLFFVVLHTPEKNISEVYAPI